MPCTLSDQNIKNIQERYEERYKRYGHSPTTLDWDKGKQNLRFHILTSRFDITNKNILDIGCGFGDLNKFLLSLPDAGYNYLGVDVVESLIERARSVYQEYNNIQFRCGDFLSTDFTDEIDIAFASGIFNMALEGQSNYDYIESTMRKAFEMCRVGLAFNFLSDRVDYPKGNTFHSSPEHILKMAYGFSRNVVLQNDYMPFEFTVFIFKDDSFLPATTIFNRWLEQHPDFTVDLLTP